MSNLVQNQNQTFQTPMLGMVTMDPQPDTVPAQLYGSSTAIVTAGTVVKLVPTQAGPNIIVDATTSASDGPIFGVIPYNSRKNVYSPQDSLEVVGRGGILMLKSSAAIQRGRALSATNALVATNDPTVASDFTVGSYILGTSLGVASAANLLLKVQVQPGIVSATGVISVTP